MTTQRPRHEVDKLAAFVKRYTLHFYSGTALLYLLLIPATLWVFPSTTLLVTMFILLTSFLGALGTLGDAIVSNEQNKTLAKVDEETSDQVEGGDALD